MPVDAEVRHTAATDQVVMGQASPAAEAAAGAVELKDVGPLTWCFVPLRRPAAPQLSDSPSPAVCSMIDMCPEQMWAKMS